MFNISHELYEIYNTIIMGIFKTNNSFYGYIMMFHKIYIKWRCAPVNFQSRQLEIDYDAYVNKIGFTENFIDIDSLTFIK